MQSLFERLWAYPNVQRVNKPAAVNSRNLRGPNQKSTSSTRSRADILKRLEQIDFKPLRPQRSAPGSAGRMLVAVVTDKALAKNVPLIEQAAAIKGDADVQALLHRKLNSFLERVRRG